MCAQWRRKHARERTWWCLYFFCVCGDHLDDDGVHLDGGGDHHDGGFYGCWGACVCGDHLDDDGDHLDGGFDQLDGGHSHYNYDLCDSINRHAGL